MANSIYILSFILFFAKYVVPVYLLFRLFFIVKPLIVKFYFDEKFNYYVGTNKSRLLILILLCFLSFFLGTFLGREVMGISGTYKIILNLFLLVLTQFILFCMFEIKTPKNIFKIVKDCFENPKEIFKQQEVVFEESNVTGSINQNGVNFKDAVNLTNGDIIKQIHRREFDLVIEKYINIFRDNSSIENLYKLCNGIEIKEYSISINIDNKRNSKQNIVEILTSLFNIQKNWNSQIKDKTNTKIIDFLNKYITINDGDKTLHINDFTRLFVKSV
ncbi:hypothetical protein LPB248_12930 [Flavobacterium sp. LPB0248]|uniref:hypothetical protein n=1 Tax=Flavobacterium sp. LPB0248 TaxID=2614441 RepID=UPI0015A6D1E2|nr:hypothetical protein [Flavobacterium sp. LPB0248]QLC67170.1 hypothetical protein LPB248_12930 [Flavobacterium sp. LPB0248]